MPLSPEQKTLLVRVIRDALQCKITLGFTEIPKLFAAAREVGSDREPIIEGLAAWLRTDPEAKGLVLEAAARAGALLFGEAPPKEVKEAEVVREPEPGR